MATACRLLSLILMPSVVLAQSPQSDQQQRLNNKQRLKMAEERRLIQGSLTNAEQQKLIKSIDRLEQDLARLRGPLETPSAAPPSRDLVLSMPFRPPGDVPGTLEQGIAIATDFKKITDEIAGPIDSTLEMYDKLAEAVSQHQNPQEPATPYSVDGFAAPN